MIYLLGGPPRCGKTTVARHLARETGAAWLQTDYLETAFAAYVAPGGYAPHPLPLPEGVPRERRNDARYNRYSAKEVVASYRALAGRTWPGLRAIVEYAAFDSEALVLDGFHLDPADIRAWLVSDGAGHAARVRPVFLVREDVADIEAALRRGDHPNDWAVTRTRDDVTFGRIAQMIAAYSVAVRRDAVSGGFPVFQMDGDFPANVAQVLAALRGEGRHASER